MNKVAAEGVEEQAGRRPARTCAAAVRARRSAAWSSGKKFGEQIRNPGMTQVANIGL